MGRCVCHTLCACWRQLTDYLEWPRKGMCVEVAWFPIVLLLLQPQQKTRLQVMLPCWSHSCNIWLPVTLSHPPTSIPILFSDSFPLETSGMGCENLHQTTIKVCGFVFTAIRVSSLAPRDWCILPEVWSHRRVLPPQHFLRGCRTGPSASVPYRGQFYKLM